MKKVKYLLSGVLVVCLVAAIFPISVGGASGVPVNIVAPAHVTAGSQFVAQVTIGDVTGFDSAQFDVTYNPAVIRAVLLVPRPLDGREVPVVTNGLIDSTVVPVDMAGFIPAPAPFTPPTQGRIRVICNVANLGPGDQGVSGSGYLAEILFEVVGAAGSSSAINFLGGLLSDFNAQAIDADWFGATVQVVACHDLTVVADPVAGGTVTGSGCYPDGADVPIDATPAACWYFLNWTGEGIANPNSQSTTVHLTSSRTVTAHFAERPDWDVNCDGCIDVADVQPIIIHWLETGPGGWIRADVNGDGIVDIADVTPIIVHWGEGCP